MQVQFGCSGFFSGMTWVHNDTFQNGGAISDGISNNVISLIGTVPAVAFALASPEMDANTTVTPAPTPQALNCHVTVTVNSISGPAGNYTYGFVIQDKVTAAVYLNVSGGGYPVSNTYAVAIPQGAVVECGFGVSLANGAGAAAGGFNISVSLGT